MSVLQSASPSAATVHRLPLALGCLIGATSLLRPSDTLNLENP